MKCVRERSPHSSTRFREEHCLAPRPRYFSSVSPFRVTWSESPKSIDIEALGEDRTGTRQRRTRTGLENNAEMEPTRLL